MLRNVCLTLMILSSSLAGAAVPEAIRAKANAKIMENAKRALGPGVGRLELKTSFMRRTSTKKVNAALWGVVQGGARPRPGVPALGFRMKRHEGKFTMTPRGTGVSVKRVGAWKSFRMPL